MNISNHLSIFKTFLTFVKDSPEIHIWITERLVNKFESGSLEFKQKNPQKIF